MSIKICSPATAFGASSSVCGFWSRVDTRLYPIPMIRELSPTNISQNVPPARRLKRAGRLPSAEWQGDRNHNSGCVVADARIPWRSDDARSGSAHRGRGQPRGREPSASVRCVVRAATATTFPRSSVSTTLSDTFTAQRAPRAPLQVTVTRAVLPRTLARPAPAIARGRTVSGAGGDGPDAAKFASPS